MSGLIRRDGPPPLGALLSAALLLTAVGPLAAAPFQDDYDDYEEEEPGPVTVNASVEGPAAVPLGNLVGLNVDVSGGEGDPWIQMEVEYGAAACRAVVEQDGAWRSEMHDFLVTVTRAGGHDVTITAEDEASPTSTDDDTLTVTGLPPDTLTPDLGVEDCILDWATSRFRETIHIDVFAGQDRMGPLYDQDLALPQEKVQDAIRPWDPMAGTYGPFSAWRDFSPVDANGQQIWDPTPPNVLGMYWFVPGDPSAGDGSYIFDGKGTTPVQSEAQLHFLAAQTAGYPFYAQRQEARVRYTSGCDAQFQFADSGVFFITATTTGVDNGSGHIWYRYRDLADFVLSATDPTIPPPNPTP